MTTDLSKPGGDPRRQNQLTQLQVSELIRDYVDELNQQLATVASAISPAKGRSQLDRVELLALDLLADEKGRWVEASEPQARDQGPPGSEIQIGGRFFKGKEMLTRVLPFAVAAATVVIFGVEAAPLLLVLGPLVLSTPDALATLRTIILNLTDDELRVLDAIRAWTAQPRRVGWREDRTEIVGLRGPTSDELADVLRATLEPKRLEETLLELNERGIARRGDNGYWHIEL